MNLRQQMIAKAMNEAGEPHTIERLARHVPEDFELGQDDIDGMPVEAEFVTVETGDGAPAVEDADFVAPDAPAAVTPARNVPAKVAAKPPADPDTIEAATVALIQANEALASARVAENVAGRKQGEAQTRFAAAVVAFQSGFVPVTKENLAREFIASEIESRRRAAAGEIAPQEYRVGNSVIDRQRAWARSGGPDSGRGNSGRAVVEGGKVYPQSMRGVLIPKAPSAR